MNDWLITCPGCGKILPSFSKFCMLDGSKIPVRLSQSKECKKCKSLLPVDAFYCIKCGLFELPLKTNKKN